MIAPGISIVIAATPSDRRSSFYDKLAALF